MIFLVLMSSRHFHNGIDTMWDLDVGKVCVRTFENHMNICPKHRMLRSCQGKYRKHKGPDVRLVVRVIFSLLLLPGLNNEDVPVLLMMKMSCSPQPPQNLLARVTILIQFKFGINYSENIFSFSFPIRTGCKSLDDRRTESPEVETAPFVNASLYVPNSRQVGGCKRQCSLFNPSHPHMFNLVGHLIGLKGVCPLSGYQQKFTQKHLNEKKRDVHMHLFLLLLHLLNSRDP